MSGSQYPFFCSNCRRETGFKYVSKLGTSSVGSYTNANARAPEDVERRASCRFCGHVRREARSV